mgnify:CR=1 FL=1
MVDDGGRSSGLEGRQLLDHVMNSVFVFEPVHRVMKAEKLLKKRG